MVENKRSDENLATLLCTLSFATGMGFGEDMEHGLKSAYLGLQLACALRLSPDIQEAVFYGALLKDVGCTACSAGISAFFPDDEQVPRADFMLVDPSQLHEMLGWLSRNVPLDARFPSRVTRLFSFIAQCGPVIREAMRGHCEVAELFARRLGFPETVQHTLRFQWERWDGKGLAYSLKASEIPLPARILHLAQVMELTTSVGGTAAARTLAREKQGTRFDPDIVEAFLQLTRSDQRGDDLEHTITREAIIQMRPYTSADAVTTDHKEDVCQALADFVDGKAPGTWHHSQLVAQVAEGIGKQLDLSPGELYTLKCSGLVHDIGKVATPFGILVKGARRSQSEWEIYRLHSYYTQRVLEQVAPLRDLAPIAASHHEWVNGQGYHRQLQGEQIPLAGRILAVANTYVRATQEMQQDHEEQTSRVLASMSAYVGTQLDPICYEALVASLQAGDVSKKAVLKRSQATDLTQREIEVVRLLTQGQNTPQIARTLSISKKTVEHHLAHIYTKFGVSCRTAAVAYAVQQNLV